MTAPDLDRRFGGMHRLYGDAEAGRIRQSHVCVVGIGGVGSWAVEALARAGVGELTLIDLDNVCESNVNRQIHALDGTFGLPKVEAMAERVRLVNPACQVHTVEDFISADNVATLLAPPVGLVIDAIDDLRAKAAMAAWCRRQSLPLLVSGAAGGRIDPTRIQVADLARVT
ncbi:tRNA threonylcarbamoyladenosine dehydratase, partial [Laribacter hongkongensis]